VPFVATTEAVRVQRVAGLRHSTRATVDVMSVTFRVELDREEDGRWIAEIPDLPGVLCYGATRDEAVAHVQALALRVLAERLEHREAPAEFLDVSFHAA
jgi:predicted RNase H-like HicB family nuclease